MGELWMTNEEDGIRKLKEESPRDLRTWSCQLESVGLEVSWMRHVGFELELSVEEFIVIVSSFSCKRVGILLVVWARCKS